MNPQKPLLNPGTAAIWSFFFVGAGQIYTGQIYTGRIGTGLALLVTVPVISLICLVGAFSQPWLLLIPPVLWIANIYDARDGAVRLNAETMKVNQEV